MSRTLSYSRLHSALADAAATFDVVPMVARVAYALHERGGRATSQELQADLCCGDSAVRRALIAMYAARLAVGVGSDGGPRRAGIVTLAKLTPRGRAMAGYIVTTLAEELAA